MAHARTNRYRAAIDVLNRGRESLMEGLVDEVLEREECLTDGGFPLHEFLDSNGSRLHFLALIVGQLEQAAEVFEESREPSVRPADEATGRGERARARRRAKPRGIGHASTVEESTQAESEEATPEAQG